jgi:hypothetical protein
MDHLIEEHHMPQVEAVLAGTLALMTGYSQFLQAEANPVHRIGMGEKITRNLAMLAEHPQLSPDCRCVLWQLHERWAVMSNCTLEAADVVLAPSDDSFSAPASQTLQ